MARPESGELLCRLCQIRAKGNGVGKIEQVLVPDIGDFKDVPVIDVLVKPGDSVKPEDPLIILESDKATIEVPSPLAGTVSEISIKVGDKVSQGTPHTEGGGGHRR